MIAVPATSCAHAMWRRFLWVTFGPKYLSEPSEEALARLYTSGLCPVGGTPNQCLFLVRVSIEAVAVPVLAPWRAICWALATSGPFSV